VLSTAFDLAVAEPVVDRTVRIEGGHMARRPLAAPEPFTRGEQHGGLVLGEPLWAAGVGLLHYEQIAQPFKWKFTRSDLHQLLARLDQPVPAPLQLAA